MIGIMGIIENICIYLAIVAITLGGILLTGQWWGLASLVMLLFVNTKIRSR